MTTTDAIIQAALAKAMTQEAPPAADESAAPPDAAVVPPVEAAPPVVDAPPPAPAAEADPAPADGEEPASVKFAKLAERERQFRQSEKKLAETQAKIEARLAELEQRETKLKNPDTLLDMIAAAGLTVEEFQRKILTGEVQVEKPQVDPIQQKLNQLEQELQQQKAFRAELEEQRKLENANKYVEDYKANLRTAATRYEALNEYFDSVDEIVDVAVKQADAYAAQYKQAPAVEDVLSQLEAYYGKYVQRFKTKFASTSATAGAAAKAEPKEPSKTMTNNHTQAASGSVATITPRDVALGKVSRDEWVDYNLKKLASKG
jgi:small-conductance mechanosensitive channel